MTQTSSQYFPSTHKSGDNRLSTTWSMESFWTILDIALKYVDEHLASSTTKEHSTDALLKEYLYDAYVRKKLIKPWKKHTQAYVEHISLDQSYTSSSKE
ncbi:hypothetical protein ACFXTH_003219 [Malus domestica]